MARTKSVPFTGRPNTFGNACLYSSTPAIFGHGGIQAGLPHLDRIEDRKPRLLLECLGPAIPELRLAVEGVQNGRGVPLAGAAVDANRGGAAIGKRAGGIVAVAHATLPSADNLPSKNSFWPRAIFSGVCGLSAGVTDRVSSTGSPTCCRDRGLASGPALGSGGAFPAGGPVVPAKASSSAEDPA